jgi:hypothetical protein
MADNQTFVFVKWSDKADIIQVDYHPSPARVSHLRDAFKAKHLAASTISTTAIHVSDAINGHELDAFDELGDLGNSRNNALHISVDHAPIFPMGDVAGPSTPRSKDVSNQIAAVFEGEVNLYLENYFQSVLPKCEFSKFKNREIDDDNVALEIDTFSYMTKDTLDSPNTNHGLGIYVVRPNGASKMKPKGAPKKLGNSPGAAAANLGATAEKYVVGESYSGDREYRIKAKVKELEEKLEKMKQRHSSQSNAVRDATSLFGAAILSFTCQTLPRKDQSKKCMKAVLEELSSAATPILWRIAQAERLFIVVLSTSEGPSTCAFREIALGVQGVEIGLDSGLATVVERQASVESGLATVVERQASVESGLATVVERLDEIQNVLRKKEKFEQH